jgi:N-formylglutamate amidohydrolase
MFKSDRPSKTPLFNYYAPLSDEFRGLLSIPHSGETVPEAFHQYLSGNISDYREDIDFKVNELVDIKTLQEAGVAILVANIHRVCVDLNRSPENAILCWENNTKGAQLVMNEASSSEKLQFINQYHTPYFEVLKATLQDLEKRKKAPVTMIDLHSMPSMPTPYHMKQNPNQKQWRPDFCLSDRTGLTCTPEFIQFFHDSLTSKNFSCSYNDPYKGGFITEYVNRFRTNNIQIEINRRLYMNELNKELIPQKAQALRPILTETLVNGFSQFNS